jgi:ABC-type transport system involved in multi-copper enzyme maturation permease subunit
MVINSLPSQFDYANAGMYSQLLMMYYWAFLLILGAGLIPLLAAVSFGSDIQRRTFELLRMAPFTAGQILTAKVMSFIILYTLASLIYLPIIGVLFFYIGVDYFELLGAYFMSTAYMLIGLSLGVYASISQLNPLKAISRTIVLAIAYYLAHLAVFPIIMVFSRAVWFGNLTNFFILYPFVIISFSILFFFVSWGVLRRKLRADQMLWIQNDDPGFLSAGIFYRDKKEKLSGKARRRVSLNRLKFGILLAILTFVAYLFMVSGGLQREGLLIWLTTIIGVLCTIATIQIAIATSKDRVAGTQDMLRMTLLHPHQIILMRILESLKNIRVMAAIGFGFILVPMLHTAYIGVFDYRSILLLICAPLAILQAVLFGQFGALFAQQYATAIVFALAALGGGMWLYMIICSDLFEILIPKVFRDGDAYVLFYYFSTYEYHSSRNVMLILNGVRLAMMLILLLTNILLYALLHHHWRPFAKLKTKGKPQ